MDGQLAGELEGTAQGDLTITDIAALVGSWNWPDHAVNLYWLTQGKHQVWFDYLGLLEQRLTGADLEDKLNRMHVTIYGKKFSVQDGSVLACILVDGNRVKVTRNMLAKMSILVG